LFLSADILHRNRLKRRVFSVRLPVSATLQILIVAVCELHEGGLHGTSIDPDHSIGCLGIGWPLAFGISWAEVLTGADRLTETADRSIRFEKQFLLPDTAIAARVSPPPRLRDASIAPPKWVLCGLLQSP